MLLAVEARENDQFYCSIYRYINLPAIAKAMCSRKASTYSIALQYAHCHTTLKRSVAPLSPQHPSHTVIHAPIAFYNDSGSNYEDAPEEWWDPGGVALMASSVSISETTH